MEVTTQVPLMMLIMVMIQTCYNLVARGPTAELLILIADDVRGTWCYVVILGADDGVAKSDGSDVRGTWLQLMRCALPKCLCP